ncbi:MAG: O-antigen ligase family protein [Patescibacteria group bacterium]
MDTSKLGLKLSWLVGGILVLLPFHAFLTVWLSSAVGHYALLRLWKEFLLLILIAGSIYILFQNKELRKKFLGSRITQLIAIYCLVSLVWGAVAYGLGKVTLKALGYGFTINLRFLVFFMAIWVIASLAPMLKEGWPRLLFIPAAAVIVIGLMQRLVLPYDVLKHFGYSSDTIFPYATINHNINYPRIMSTLRGANPLGAYLLLVLSGTMALLFGLKKHRRLWALIGFAGLVALFFTYSRGAWVGLVLGLTYLFWAVLKKRKAKKIAAAGLILLILAVAGLLLAFRHNPTFENYFFHTEKNSQVAVSSNEGHASAFKSGLNDVLNEPLGRGVGTAGPASVYNDQITRVSENYFIQIAQEVGWIGLVLFLAINLLVARELWLRRTDTLSLGLLASLAGLTFVSLVSHVWTDDTLAYLWWGLAGVALAPLQPLTVNHLLFKKGPSLSRKISSRGMIEI